METTKITLRSATLVAIGAILISLTACTGAGLNVPAGQAYLTIQNPNDPTKGTFDYTNITFDGSPLSALPNNKIAAGQSFTLASTVTTGTPHTLVMDFVQQPTGTATPTITKESGIVITISSSQSTYTYVGPTYAGP